MPCPHCASPTTCARLARTQLGYRTFTCLTCRRSFNERIGNFEAAARFCQACEELRQFERYRRMRAGTGSLAEWRHQFLAGMAALQAMLLGA